MKKILLYLPIIMLTFWSCDQMDEIYDDLDKNVVVPYSESIEYLFTSADYKLASQAALVVATNASDSALATSIEKDMAFNDLYTASNFVGPILAANFPALNLTSVALVTYNVETGTSEAHLPYLDADDYELDVDDYNSVGGLTEIKGYFIPSSLPDASIPGILATEIASPEADDIVMVTYKYYDVEPTDSLSSVEIFAEDFSEYANYDSIGSNGWSQVEEVGAREWTAREYSGNVYAQYSSYGSDEENVSWLISPEIELGDNNNKLTFDVNIGYYTHSGLQVLISEDFDGSNFGTATWDDITSDFTIPTEPTNDYGDFASAGLVDLDYSGDIYIAFKYTGDGANSETTTYQIDNIVVTSGIEDLSDEYNVYYEYSGTAWSMSDDVKAIQPVEYDAMGSPGKYNNFSSSAAPENYLPQFLASYYPYAQEGDVKTISYRYYSGGTVTMLDDYVYESGVWKVVSSIVENTDQYIYSPVGWVFDPTVKFTMIASDYALITVSVLADNPSYGYTDGSREFYYGSVSKYANFDLRISKRDEFSIPGFDGLTDADAIALMWERMPEAINLMLTLKYPDAVTAVSGIDVHYFVTFYTYENDLSSNYYTIEFQCTKAGPSSEFTQIGDIEIVE